MECSGAKLPQKQRWRYMTGPGCFPVCQFGFIISFTLPPCVRDFSAETWLLLCFLLLSMFAFLGLDVSSVF